MIIVATNEPLLHHGEGAALVGLLFAAIAFAITRKGISGARRANNIIAGRYLALFILRWLFLAVGITGVVLILMAALT
jgi:hypothetical protein